MGLIYIIFFQNPQNQEHGQLKKDFLSEVRDPIVPTESSLYSTPPIPNLTLVTFYFQVYACVIRLLKPFRLPNCLTGRIENDDDMKYIAKKVNFYDLAFKNTNNI